MLGKPKFAKNQKVQFQFNEYILTGVIEIIDAYGTFEQDRDVSYDIMVEDSPHYNHEPCLYKHIEESYVLSKIED